MFSLEKRTTLILGLAALLLGVAGYWVWKSDFFDGVAFIVNEETHPVLFIALMAVLPSVGSPISIFLVLVGIKFGLAGGLLITVLAIPLHMTASFLIANSMLRRPLEAFLKKRGYRLPRVPENRRMLFTMLFVGVPGLPYALKNYILALTDLPFRYYFGIAWLVHFALTIPFIGLGKAAGELNLTLSVIFLCVLLGVYILRKWLKDKFSQIAH